MKHSITTIATTGKCWTGPGALDAAEGRIRAGVLRGGQERTEVQKVDEAHWQHCLVLGKLIAMSLPSTAATLYFVLPFYSQTWWHAFANFPFLMTVFVPEDLPVVHRQRGVAAVLELGIGALFVD